MATRTWDGGGTGELASTAENWSDDTAPIAGDIVVFDGTSSKNCTFDLTADFASINTTGYGGLVTASATITISGNVTFANSTFAHGNQRFVIDASSTIDCGTAGNTFYELSTSASLTVTLTNDITVEEELLVQSGTDVTWAGAGKYVNIKKDVQTTNSASFFNFPISTATFRINGGANQTINFNTPGTGTRAIGNAVIFESTGGTVTMQSVFNNDMHFSGGLTYTSGTVDWTTNSVVVKFVGNQNINTGTMEINKATISTATSTLTGNFKVKDFTIASGATFAPGANTVTITGNFVNSGTFTRATSTVVFSGTSAQRIVGNTSFNILTFLATRTINIASSGSFVAASSFNALGSAGSLIVLSATTSGQRGLLTVASNQNVNWVIATDIDSSKGNTVVNSMGTVSNTINWIYTTSAMAAGSASLIFFEFWEG